MTELTDSPLGKASLYSKHYDPNLLFAISREEKRREIGIARELPFHGVDVWTAYEVSWLTNRGKPVVAIAELMIPHDSPNLVESKSLKLYFNSLNQTHFADLDVVNECVVRDISAALGKALTINWYQPRDFKQHQIESFAGYCLDDLDISTDAYQYRPDFLQASGDIVDESCYSDLLKSNCLITNQPDWGSVYFHYRGPKIDPVGLLKYIVSFREHNEFHEQCVERMFVDIMQRCQPQQLTVYARYTRRGGLDINPFRSNFEEHDWLNKRLGRQ